MSNINTKPILVSERSWPWIGGAALLYAALLWLTLQLSVQQQGVAIFSFAHPVGVVALLALVRRRWPHLLLVLGVAAFVVYAGQEWRGPSLQSGALWRALGMAGVAVAEMWLAAGLMRRFGGIRREDLYSPHRLARLLLWGAVLPVSCSALLVAFLAPATSWPVMAETVGNWLVGHLIGTVATLPLALAIWLRPRPQWSADLVRPAAVPLVLLSAGVTLAGATTLPHPFVVMIIPMVLLALNAGFAMTAAAGWITALLVVGLLKAGVLLAPPSAVWWGDMLYYGALLAALIPGLFLASSVEGQAIVLQQILANEERYRKLYAETPAMMHSADAIESIGGPILSVSERWLKVTGYRREEVVGHQFVEFLTPDSVQFALHVAVPQLLSEGHCEDFEGQMLARDGRVLDVLFSAVLERDTDGRPVRTYAVIQDITEKKRLAAKSHYAEHDALTGLPNRVLMDDRLNRICAHHERHGGSFAVGFLDLDHFKDINDRYGHEAGDDLLRGVAQRLLDALRATDTVCRLGGDEFVLLISDADDADLDAVAAKVLLSVARPMVLECDGQRPEVAVSASLGIAIYPQHGRDPQSLLQHADEAMYRSKHSGRNRFEVYTPGALSAAPASPAAKGSGQV